MTPLTFAIFSLCNVALAWTVIDYEQSDENWEPLYFPGQLEVAPDSARIVQDPVSSRLQYTQLLDKASTMEEFFQLFSPDDLHDSGILADRFGSSSSSRNLTKSEPAICKPEPQVVCTTENPDPAAFYFPRCVRINRCGGCCNTELLSCQPKTSRIQKHQIFKTCLHKNSGKPYVHSKIFVELEEHTSCECRCKKTEKDCSERHYYDDVGCSCVCKNAAHEEAECNRQYLIKEWNNATCTCDCRNVEECSTNFYFNEERCRCERGSPYENY